MIKGHAVRDILERRIRHGDYLLTGLPAERELAVEIGVSRMTARKALQDLIDRGLLQREANGRVRVKSGNDQGTAKIAFLVPSIISADVDCWRLALERVCGEMGASVRTVLYVHWNDPLLLQALDSFDGAFLYLGAEAMPAAIQERLERRTRPVVAIDHDLTALGVPSIQLFPASFIRRLLDDLARLGHTQCDCFNIQTVDAVIESRIAQWNVWRAHRRMEGKLLGRPIPAYGRPLIHAYDEMKRLLAEGELRSTSLLCTTAPAALGAMRAMHEHGIRVGQDVSVCVVNDEGLARYITPSLTTIQMPDPSPYVAVCIEWMLRAGQEWLGPMLMQPDQVELFVGESTGPVPK